MVRRLMFLALVRQRPQAPRRTYNAAILGSSYPDPLTTYTESSLSVLPSIHMLDFQRPQVQTVNRTRVDYDMSECPRDESHPAHRAEMVVAELLVELVQTRFPEAP